jgi:hypothetical protein
VAGRVTRGVGGARRASEDRRRDDLQAGTQDNWPEYLRRVKKKGLLTTTGDPNADYVLLAQIGFHGLFTWLAPESIPLKQLAIAW